MAKALNPQTPGEVVEDPVEAVEVAAPAAGAEETVTVSKSQLEAIVAVAVKKAVAAGPVVSAKASDENLPDQSTVDPLKIKKPVLTKQGWVVPDKFGANPNQPK